MKAWKKLFVYACKIHKMKIWMYIFFAFTFLWCQRMRSAALWIPSSI